MASGNTVNILSDFVSFDTTVDGTVNNKRGFEILPGAAIGTDTNIGFYGGLTSDDDKNYNYYASGNAPNFFAGDTYIGGTTTTLGDNTHINLNSNGSEFKLQHCLDFTNCIR